MKCKDPFYKQKSKYLVAFSEYCMYFNRSPEAFLLFPQCRYIFTSSSQSPKPRLVARVWKVEGGRLGATVIRYIVLSRELSTEASLDTGSEVRQRFRWRLLDTRASNEGPKNTRRFIITGKAPTRAFSC